jgi:N-acetylglucosaminyl-diphospho-decaprenol L-rhamnosyltransferase
MAVVVVSYNTRDLLSACLDSVLAQGPSEIVVVDNASIDGSSEMVAERFPSVILLVNPTNVGFGRAANQGIRACAAPYVLLLNSDTLAFPGTLEALSTYLDGHPTAAVIGPRLLNPSGSQQASERAFPTPLDLALDWSHVYGLVACTPLRGRFARTRSQDRDRQVEWIVGAALAIRRTAFDVVGGFDQSFFMYFEEVDLCYRLRQAGWDVHFTPIASVAHVGGASTRQQRTEMIVQFFASLSRFYEHHYTARRQRWLTVMVPVVAVARLARDVARWRLSHDPDLRRVVRGDIATWLRLLRGQWRNQRDPVGIG